MFFSRFRKNLGGLLALELLYLSKKEETITKTLTFSCEMTKTPTLQEILNV